MLWPESQVDDQNKTRHFHPQSGQSQKCHSQRFRSQKHHRICLFSMKNPYWFWVKNISIRWLWTIPQPFYAEESNECYNEFYKSTVQETLWQQHHRYHQLHPQDLHPDRNLQTTRTPATTTITFMEFTITKEKSFTGDPVPHDRAERTMTTNEQTNSWRKDETTDIRTTTKRTDYLGRYVHLTSQEYVSDKHPKPPPCQLPVPRNFGPSWHQGIIYPITFKYQETDDIDIRGSQAPVYLTVRELLLLDKKVYSRGNHQYWTEHPIGSEIPSKWNYQGRVYYPLQIKLSGQSLLLVPPANEITRRVYVPRQHQIQSAIAVPGQYLRQMELSGPSILPPAKEITRTEFIASCETTQKKKKKKTE